MSKTCDICGNMLDIFDEGTDISNVLFCEKCYRSFDVLIKENKQEEFSKAWFQLQNAIKDSKLKDKEKTHALGFLDTYLVNRNLSNFLATEDQLNAIKEQQRELQKAQEERKALFAEARLISDTLLVLDSKKVWAIVNQGTISKPYQYTDLTGFSVELNGNQVQSGNEGKVLIGRLLLGATGALMGAASSRHINEYINDFRIKITVNDIDHPVFQIVLINSSTLKYSSEYEAKVHQCEDIIGMLEYIKSNGRGAQNQTATITGHAEGEKARAIYAFSVADEISKFHQLAKDGIITDEEFQRQKQKLLSLEY